MIPQSQIESIAKKIAQTIQPDKIILFGSYAWGTPGPDSDLDLFIVKNTENTRTMAGDIRGSLWDYPAPMDIIVYKPETVDKSLKKGNFFIRDIITKGKILYERQ